jgi:hypothetical protein
MSMSPQALTSPYWLAVRQEEDKLPPQQTYFLTSLALPTIRSDPHWRAGIVFEVATRRMAAQRLAEGTHRLSTPEEIAAYHAAQKQREDELRVIEDRRRSSTILKMPSTAALKKLGEV